MRKYIDFQNISSKRLTTEIVNTCYQYINKELVQNKLANNDILPEVKLYYLIN